MLCVLMLMTCFFPASVTALGGVATDKQEMQQSQQMESEDEQKDSDQDVQQKSENKAATERTDKAETKTQQQDKGALNDTQTKAALSSIIAQDKQGKDLCYTTLYDSKDRIVDTNDPKKKQDTYYKPKSEGGKGGTVDLGASLRVYFRMAEIIEHDGDKAGGSG